MDQRVKEPGEALNNNANDDASQRLSTTESKTSCNIKDLRTDGGIQAREFGRKKKGEAVRVVGAKARDPSAGDDMFQDYLELWVQVRSFTLHDLPVYR